MKVSEKLTKWSNIATIIIAVANIVIIIITGFHNRATLKEMQNTYKLMKEDKDTRLRPSIGIDKFDIKRGNDKLTPQDTLALHIKNYGTIPANDVNIFISVFDELDVREKKELSYKWTFPQHVTIMPTQSFEINDEVLQYGSIKEKDIEEYEKRNADRINFRSNYYEKNKEFPRQDLIYVKLEIKYRGLQKTEQLPYYFNATYKHEIKYKKTKAIIPEEIHIWSISHSEAN